jgi:hypothetical protein
MLGKLFSTGRNGSGSPGLEPLAARKLQAALTRLPPEWLVLRSRYARGLDGPPWVKFIALHSQKGIALIDVAPADPEAAVEALDEFLARTGLDAFSRGDPPIVALALNPGDDVAAIDRYLADAFAAAAPCGIKNANWTEAVAALLLATPGLLLTQIAPVPDMTVPDTPVPLTPPKESERAAAMTTPAPSASPELPPIAAPIAAVPDAGNLRDAVLRAEKDDAPVPIDDAPVPIDDAPEIATKRQIWAVSGTFAASLVLGSIGLVYLDRPNGASTALIEAERAAVEAQRQAPPAAPPATIALAPARAEDVAASAAEPIARAAPSPRQRRHAVLATRPPWESAKANGKTKTATSSRAALRKRRRSDDLPKEVFTAVNNWFLEVQSSVRSVIR